MGGGEGGSEGGKERERERERDRRLGGVKAYPPCYPHRQEYPPTCRS